MKTQLACTLHRKPQVLWHVPARGARWPWPQSTFECVALKRARDSSSCTLSRRGRRSCNRNNISFDVLGGLEFSGLMLFIPNCLKSGLLNFYGLPTNMWCARLHMFQLIPPFPRTPHIYDVFASFLLHALKPQRERVTRAVRVTHSRVGLAEVTNNCVLGLWCRPGR